MVTPCFNSARFIEETIGSMRGQDASDWEQILVLYDLLLHLQPNPVTRLHRAVAVHYVKGAKTALDEVDDLQDTLDNHALYHAIRAELLRALGESARAHEADQRALQLTNNPAQLDILHSRLARE